MEKNLGMPALIGRHFFCAQARNQYRQTILNAFAEVENVLLDRRKLLQRSESLDIQMNRKGRSSCHRGDDQESFRLSV